jgi:hypothetical protein
MQNSLLAHIASNFISEYENVANSSIAYLLNEYPASQAALKNILGIDKVPTYYITEMVTTSNGRPDVTGFDQNGEKAIIIEGKFWASLTDNQPNNYLKELSSDGKLIFLAPDKRLSSLKIEIEKKLGGENNRVFICSWNNLLELIEIENNKNHNHQLASDLMQLKELCQKMDTEGMPPLSMSDLDPMNGRVASQFSDVIDECNPILREWEHSDFARLITTSFKYGYGFYFRGYEFMCLLHYDSYNWFVRENHTPIWLKIIEKDKKKTKKISHVLNDFDSLNSYESDYGIVLQTGMDKSQVVDHIAEKVKEVLTYLNNRLPNE